VILGFHDLSAANWREENLGFAVLQKENEGEVWGGCSVRQ
jgi:hypothetical protein